MDGQKLIKPLVDIPQMAEIVKSMIDESIESFLKENTDLAYKMAQTDDQVEPSSIILSSRAFRFASFLMMT